MGSISNSQAADKDRISELPDALLGHILSFLPTIWAVRTTVLSTRWNNVWTCVSNLDFDCGYFYSCHGYDFDRFHMFVERVLSLTDSSDLKKVSLNTEVTDFARVEGWICTVVRRNVVELVLFLYADNEKEYTFVLPISVFSCKTLKVLELWGSLRISVPYAPPASHCFPSLKSLYVSDAFPCFTNCPLLEHLTINARFRNIVTYYKIKVSAPELKTLTISDMEHNVYIDAPKLEDLYVLAIVVPNYSLDARSLVDADIEAYFAKDAISILADFSNVKYLSLSAIHIEAGHLPIFPNLNRLKVVIRYCNYWESIGLLLDKSPNLENLVLSEEDVKPQWNQIDSELQWDPPKVVPNCLSSHLKTISILSFRARKVEMEVVKYLLKNGDLLDKMTIKYEGYLRTKDFKALYRELNMFQRASMTCQVELG